MKGVLRQDYYYFCVMKNITILVPECSVAQAGHGQLGQQAFIRYPQK